MVLFVFVIMLLNAGAEERTRGSAVAIRFGVPGVLVLAATIAYTLLHSARVGERVAIGALYGSPVALGRLLFRDFLLPFEVTSVLILIAIMGAVVLARAPEAPQQARRTQEELRRELEREPRDTVLSTTREA
jgi:NADH-quinone oxidoreductase subunit J